MVVVPAGFDPSKPVPPKREVVVVGAPKLTLPAVVEAVAPNVNPVLAAGVPKLRPPNKGAEVVGAGNKLVAVVVAVVFEPNNKPGWVWVVVAGVLPNPKLRPAVVAGVAEAPKLNVVAGVVEPNGVLVRLKPVAGF